MKHSLLIVILSFVFFIPIFSQESDSIQKSDSLIMYVGRLNSLFSHIVSEENDYNKSRMNNSIHNTIKEMSENEDSFLWTMDSVRFIGKFVSSDLQMAMYTWIVPLSDNKFLYNAVFQSADGDLWSLKNSKNTAETTDFPVSEKDWYGALYYEIIPFKSADKEDLYLLLGWRKFADKQQKVIDILDISSGEIVLGKPLFEQEVSIYGKKQMVSQNRVWFEYDTRVSMFMNYNEKKKRVELDNLSPMEVVDGQVLSYGPDFSVNAYQFKKGRWIFVDDIKVKNYAE